jgi:hypothetical protein
VRVADDDVLNLLGRKQRRFVGSSDIGMPVLKLKECSNS